ncbi:hypothetical protein Nepgr_026830 [Nepenthes gracilis]|uniref:Ubiquitin-like domain-containing protein n=1 Tax=Nepenthes gracilis TaxID=150966 RepID=A0AAD3Y0R2_NEPGR|nr:hypothetical protein Nepgr_026830 [Nepenthes gracilis]
MDVIFETQKGTPFCIEIGFFDTVLEIKEKIQKYRDIPVTQQTLILDGKVLEDDGTVESCNIFQNSHIRLIVVAHEPEEQPKIKIEEQSPVSMKVQLLLRLPTPKSQKIAVQMEMSDTVEQLKKKINEIEGFPANRLVLHANENTEMQDHTCLHEYHLTDGSEIDITVRPSSATSGTSAAGGTAANVSGSKRLKVMVLPPGGTKKMAVEVGAWEKVQVDKD